MTHETAPFLEEILRAADDAASVAHDFIWGRNSVTKEQASDAIWTIHNALRPLFEDDPEPSGGKIVCQPERTEAEQREFDAAVAHVETICAQIKGRDDAAGGWFVNNTASDQNAWGLFEMPADADRAEWKMAKSGVPLSRGWRGLIAEFPSREEAFDAWEHDGQFCRELSGERRS